MTDLHWQLLAFFRSCASVASFALRLVPSAMNIHFATLIRFCTGDALPRWASFVVEGVVRYMALVAGGDGDGHDDDDDYDDADDDHADADDGGAGAGGAGAGGDLSLRQF